RGLIMAISPVSIRWLALGASSYHAPGIRHHRCYGRDSSTYPSCPARLTTCKDENQMIFRDTSPNTSTSWLGLVSLLCVCLHLAQRFGRGAGFADIHRDPVQVSCEGERHLVISVVDRCARIHSNVERLIPCKCEREGLREIPLSDLLVVHRQRTAAPAAD